MKKRELGELPLPKAYLDILKKEEESTVPLMEWGGVRILLMSKTHRQWLVCPQPLSPSEAIFIPDEATQGMEVEFKGLKARVGPELMGELRRRDYELYEALVEDDNGGWCLKLEFIPPTAKYSQKRGVLLIGVSLCPRMSEGSEEGDIELEVPSSEEDRSPRHHAGGVDYAEGEEEEEE
jgi:hypothetical protein